MLRRLLTMVGGTAHLPPSSRMSVATGEVLRRPSFKRTAQAAQRAQRSAREPVGAGAARAGLPHMAIFSPLPLWIFLPSSARSSRTTGDVMA